MKKADCSLYRCSVRCSTGIIGLSIVNDIHARSWRVSRTDHVIVPRIHGSLESMSSPGNFFFFSGGDSRASVNYWSTKGEVVKGIPKTCHIVKACS